MQKEIKDFDGLLGHTLASVENIDNDQLLFTLSNGDQYKLYHDQDCCESVYIADINGELSDLVGNPLLLVEEVSGETGEDAMGEHYTWTFYKLATRLGYVTIRWCGTSNGYYSESVDWGKVS